MESYERAERWKSRVKILTLIIPELPSFTKGRSDSCIFISVIPELIQPKSQALYVTGRRLLGLLQTSLPSCCCIWWYKIWKLRKFLLFKLVHL